MTTEHVSVPRRIVEAVWLSLNHSGDTKRADQLFAILSRATTSKPEYSYGPDGKGPVIFKNHDEMFPVETSANHAMTFEEWRDKQGFPVNSTQEPLWRESWQAAQRALLNFDRAPETSRRIAAVEQLLAMGYVWDDGEWIRRAPKQPASRP